MTDQDSTVVGVSMIVRGGDRLYNAQYLYQDMGTPPPGPALTPLGQQQEFELGTLLRSIYLDASSPSFIPGLSGLYNSSEVIIRADGSADGEHLPDSAVALGQGMWPPSTNNNMEIANGTIVVGPLGGYQYTLVTSVLAPQDYSLKGQLYCNTFGNRVSNIANTSPQLKQLTSEITAAMPQLQQVVFTDFDPDFPLEYLGEIYDFMNVQSIHNASYASSLPDGLFDQVRSWNNQLASTFFTDPDPTGVGNIAGLTVISDAYSGLLSSSEPTLAGSSKIHIDVVDWQPFLSLLNITGVLETDGLQPALVDYAAAMVFELRNSSSGDLTVRLNFKNGSTDTSFHTLPMVFGDWNGGGGKDVPFATFEDNFFFNGIRNWTTWCNLCEPIGSLSSVCLLMNLTQAAGADTTGPLPSGSASPAAASSSIEPDPSSVRTSISPVGAGFLGAGLTVAVLSALFGFLVFLGVFSYSGLRRPRLHRASWRRDTKMRGDELELHSEVNSVVGLKR